jgi:polar amino acid transport system substrate-binding protein
MQTRVVIAAVVILILAVTGAYYYTSSTQPVQEQPKLLVVGTNTPFPPFEYTQNNTVTGFDIETIRALAKMSGYDDVVVKDLPFDSLITALQQGQIDVIAAGMTITADRQQQVDFTNSYWEADQSILVRNGTFLPQSLMDLKGKTVGVQTGTTGADLAEKNNATLGPIKEYDTFLLAVLDLVDGRLDAVIVDSPVAVAFTNQYPVLVASTVKTGEVWGFAVKKGNTTLLNALNAALAAFKNSPQWNALIQKYFGTRQQ